MGVTHYKRVTELSAESGLPHSHWMGWINGGVPLLLARLQRGDASLTREDLDPVVELARAVITVSLTVPGLLQQFPGLAEQAVGVAALARRVQVHQCTPHCTTSFPPGQQCSQFFPQLPSLFHLQSRRPEMGSETTKENFNQMWNLHERLQDLLRQEQHLEVMGEDPVTSMLALLHQLGPDPVILNSGSYLWAGLEFEHTPELERLLEEVSAHGPPTVSEQMLLALYHQTLLYRRHGKLLPARRVSEVWVVQYCPELLLANQGNVEINLVTHTVPHLLDYMAKGSTSQTIGAAAQQQETWGRTSLAEQLRDVWGGGWREVSLTEGLYILFRDIHLTSTNSAVTWVGLEPPGALVVLYILR